MRVAVVNLMKCSDNSIVASNRIAKYLAFSLGCNLIDQKEAITSYEHDILYVVNGPMLYCNWRDDFKKLVDKSKIIVWVANEYGIDIPKFIKDKNPYVIANYENINKVENYAMVNWNYLTYNPNIKPQKKVYKGLCYYGSYRQGRERYFKKYFTDEADYKTYISSSSQGVKKFKSLMKKATYFDGKNLLGLLGKFESSLYIEDEFTHTCYNNPANRFYECISAQTLQFFDQSCLGTFDKAGVDIRPYLVNSKEEYFEKLKNSDRLLMEQVEAWHGVNYIGYLYIELKKAIKTLGL